MIGQEKTVTIRVTDKDTAKEFGSGSIGVYATPKMVGLMERASLELADEGLEPGYTTVGTSVNVRHIAATPVGMAVSAKARIVEVDRKRLVFEVEAWDETEKIGDGIHERFIVNVDKFMEKNDLKAGK
ncbi:MAG: thioesterase family protein [Eubacteriaceae bacterium]|nr:thioesterase family protein [Eubacteriaceae bacterium]